MEKKKSSICTYCKKEIEKTRAPERIGGRVWRWAIAGVHFYCPLAGGDCWHEPNGD